MNKPISLQQILHFESVNDPKQYSNGWRWVYTFMVRPGAKRVIFSLKTILKVLLNLWVVLLLILPFAIRLYFDIRFSFIPEDDFLMTGLECFISTIWLLLLISLCLTFILLNSFKKALVIFVGSILSSFLAGYIVRKFTPGDYIHLNKDYALYQSEIQKNPKSRHRFKWGSVYGFVTSISGHRILVYDPTDTLPDENEARRKKFKSGTRIFTKYLYDHFYVEDYIY